MEGLGGRGRVSIHPFGYNVLFEATADSEVAKCFFDQQPIYANATANINTNTNTNTTIAVDDDARSCSMEWMVTPNSISNLHQQVEDETVNNDGLQREESAYAGDDNEEDDDDEDGVVDQCPLVKKKLMKNDNNSNAKQIDQREKDRLFWEECLAS